MKLHRKFQKTLLIITLAFLLQTNIYANMPEYNRIVFVIDASGSMNANDPDRLVPEFIKMFIDAAHSGKTEVGFVVFNDTILMSYPISPIATKNERNDIKQELDKIVYRGSTDIGLAIRYGMNMFPTDDTSNNFRSSIVLFSDGETDLRFTRTGRTVADSLEDEQAAFLLSDELNIPIYAVGLRRYGVFNVDHLINIANRTSGEVYEISTLDDMLPLFKEVFTDVVGAEIISRETIIATGGAQTVTIDTSDHTAEEINVITWLGTSYEALKIREQSLENINVNFTAPAGTRAQINTVSFYNFIPVLSDLQNLSDATIPIETYLYNFITNTAVTESSFYEGLVASLIVTDFLTGIENRHLMENTGTSFTYLYHNNMPRSVTLQVQVEKAISGRYFASTSIVPVSFGSTPPVQIIREQRVLRQDSIREFDLNDFFMDINGGALSFEATNTDGNNLNFEINQNILRLTPSTLGTHEVLLNVKGERSGDLVGVISFNIAPFWIYYSHIIIGIGFIFVVLSALYAIYTKRTRIAEIITIDGEEVKQVSQISGVNSRFAGARFEGYFLNTLSGKEIPILNWNASYINNKHIISLGEMFNMLDVDEKLREAHKIFFQVGNNSTVIFYHDTDCIIDIGRRSIPKGKSEVLKWDDKIYIVFEDHATEIEIRYKRIRNQVK